MFMTFGANGSLAVLDLLRNAFLSCPVMLVFRLIVVTAGTRLSFVSADGRRDSICGAVGLVRVIGIDSEFAVEPLGLDGCSSKSGVIGGGGLRLIVLP